MKKMIVLLAGIFFCSGVSASRLCTYWPADGSNGMGREERQGMSLRPKISADPALPVGAILYRHTIGNMDLHYRKFTCDPGAQYTISVSRPEVPGMSVRGMPVYETGVNGIGIQLSDVVSNRVGNQIVGQAGSWPTPVSTWSDIPKTPHFTIWLVKTGPIDTSGATNIDVEIAFGVADPAGTIPAEREGKFYWVNPKTSAITFRDKSCNISLRGPSTVNLQKIPIGQLPSGTGEPTGYAGKTIDMNITCPTAMQGEKLIYWFNPLGAVSTKPGVLENTVSVGAQNVGIILKKGGTPVEFNKFINPYQIQPLSLQQDISFTANYYKIGAPVTEGMVKAMLEVVIQED